MFLLTHLAYIFFENDSFFRILNSLKSYPEHNKIHRSYVYACDIHLELKHMPEECK